MAILETLQLNVIHVGLNDYAILFIVNCSIFCMFPVLLFQCMMFALSLVAPPTEPTLAAGCANNQECPDHAACRNRLCINPCAYDNPCAPNANCRVVNHEPVCTCPDGFIGSPETSCELRKILHDL